MRFKLGVVRNQGDASPALDTLFDDIEIRSDDDAGNIGDVLTKQADGSLVLAAPSGSGGGAAWGGITGTLSAQTDLQVALDAKSPLFDQDLNTTDPVTFASVSAGTGPFPASGEIRIGNGNTWTITSQDGNLLDATIAEFITNAEYGLLSLGIDDSRIIFDSMEAGFDNDNTTTVQAHPVTAYIKVSVTDPLADTDSAVRFKINSKTYLFGTNPENSAPTFWVVGGGAYLGSPSERFNEAHVRDIVGVETIAGIDAGVGAFVISSNVAINLAPTTDLTINGTPGVTPSAGFTKGLLTDGSVELTNVKATLQTAAAATTGLTAGELAALTNASIVITDGAGQVYRVPVII